MHAQVQIYFKTLLTVKSMQVLVHMCHLHLHKAFATWSSIILHIFAMTLDSTSTYVYIVDIRVLHFVHTCTMALYIMQVVQS